MGHVRLVWLAAIAGAAGGCGLINSKTFSHDYAFDAQQFMVKLANDNVMQTVPRIACDPTANPNSCSMAQSQVPAGAATTLSCDSATKECFAVADLHLLYPVDLTQQKLPADVLQYGADSVEIKKIAYWIASKTVNIDVPQIDLYVAGQSAKSEQDASAVQIGSIAAIPVSSTSCQDAVDPEGDPQAQGARVCDVNLTNPGALANFVKNYKTPFQLIAHARVTAKPGQPLPAGSIQFYLRPTVTFYFLK
jgi:hypothetical protein